MVVPNSGNQPVPKREILHRPGKPVENAYIESFNGRFRDECLNEHWFVTMAHARQAIEAWRIEYNTERPHSSLDDLTPEQYAKKISKPELLPPCGRETALRGEDLDENRREGKSLTPDSSSRPY